MGALLDAAALAGAGSPGVAAQALLARPRARHAARHTARHAARHSVRKRTPKLLLDVPRLELDATIDVETETRSHVERLEERHGQGISNRGDEPGVGGCEAGQPAALE